MVPSSGDVVLFHSVSGIPTFPGWFETTRLVALATHWGDKFIGKKRAETKPGWEYQVSMTWGAPPLSALGLLSIIPEGATGMAKN